MHFIARLLAPLALVASLGACAVAPQLPLEMNDAAMKGEQRVGVVMTEVPKASLNVPGASCLLCLAFANAANSGVFTHIQTLPVEDIAKIKAILIERINKKGTKVVVIETALDLKTLPDFANKAPDFPVKDFSSFKKQHNIDSLIVLEIEQIGITRTYASYFPTSPPRVHLGGMGYMVNLSTNKYEWYRPVQVFRDAGGSWDEPPKYPGLTNAYFQVLEAAKDEFLKPFGE
jgi:hypothetical protein